MFLCVSLYCVSLIAIVKLLLINNEDLLLECVRVLGNISKLHRVRHIMANNRGIIILN